VRFSHTSFFGYRDEGEGRMRRLSILLIAILVLLAVLFIRQPIELRAPEITDAATQTGYVWPLETSAVD
jgi:hypothetical protein